MPQRPDLRRKAVELIAIFGTDAAAMAETRLHDAITGAEPGDVGYWNAVHEVVRELLRERRGGEAVH